MQSENSEQVCQQCGKCCSKCAGTISACPDDIIRWIQTDRFDILQHFACFETGYTWCDELWDDYMLAEPDFLATVIKCGADLLTPAFNSYQVCPFRRKLKDGYYKCAIHDTKPDMCKEFTPWKPGWAIDGNGNSHDVSPDSYTWCEAMKLVRGKLREV